MTTDELIAEDVRNYGFSVADIYDADPPFYYTIGLMFSQAHPELIIFGLPKNGSLILREMAHLIQTGKSFLSYGEYQDILANCAIATRPVHPTQHEFYFGFAMGYCRDQGRPGELQAVQIFWPDSEGRMPFDPGCEEQVWKLQPRLDQPLGPIDLADRRAERDSKYPS